MARDPCKVYKKSPKPGQGCALPFFRESVASLASVIVF